MNKKRLETQDSISEWARTTFGETVSLYRIITRANEEMTELLSAVESNPENAAEEAADVAIVLCRFGKITYDIDVLKKYPPDTIFDDAKALTSYASSANAHLAWALTYLTGSAEPGKIDPLALAHHNVQWCVFYLHKICEDLGSDLRAEIDKKMQINRNRNWELDGTGHGYHSQLSKDEKLINGLKNVELHLMGKRSELYHLYVSYEGDYVEQIGKELIEELDNRINEIQSVLYGAPRSGTCRICGCDDNNTADCERHLGHPCVWINDEETICSACQTGVLESHL